MSTVTLVIDGKTVTAEKGTSLLEAARSVGIDIPTLCYSEQLKPAGSCRMCMVEVT
ncbi:MAG: (2Fe-2S)-binding protein, partial [Spirochaetales bacterium]|nr:(2Fe-2S)-binding protein [Spirochaetales bacterium]